MLIDKHTGGITMHRILRRSPALMAAALTACTTHAAAQDANGYTWATITHAGNRATIPSEVPFNPTAQIGRVDYEYRMATTEVTVGQWFEFVQAYLPIDQANGGGTVNPNFTGTSINIRGIGVVEIREGVSPRRPADMSWEYAARYVNWLHNGKVNEEWAFETGVYDTSTFTFNPDGTSNHQSAPAEGARYWIPTRDEWNKAAYYDPNRYGEDQEGYWIFPDSGNAPLISNLLPEDGGEKNAGDFGADSFWPLDVGSFADVQSPWGLLDMAGGMWEWTSSPDLGSPAGPERRWVMGSNHFDFQDNLFTGDRIEFGATYSVNVNVATGLRLASPVPSVSTWPVVLAGLFSASRRRHRSENDHKEHARKCPARSSRSQL